VVLRELYALAARSVPCRVASLIPALRAWAFVGIGYFHAERGEPFGAIPNALRGSLFR